MLRAVDTLELELVAYLQLGQLGFLLGRGFFVDAEESTEGHDTPVGLQFVIAGLDRDLSRVV